MAGRAEPNVHIQLFHASGVVSEALCHTICELRLGEAPDLAKNRIGELTRDLWAAAEMLGVGVWVKVPGHVFMFRMACAGDVDIAGAGKVKWGQTSRAHPLQEADRELGLG